jgi:ABC-type phosphate transport system substrate-binding protein
MANYRFAALALATCAASLSVAACSAGITTASSPATSAPATARSASVAAAASSPAGSGRTIAIRGSVSSFPVPAGAKVAENIASGQQVVVIFSLVSPSKVSSFYATALSRAGYSVSANSVISQGGGTVTFIQFSGHGYKGNIDTLSNSTGSGISIPGLGTRNVTTITLMPK